MGKGLGAYISPSSANCVARNLIYVAGSNLTAATICKRQTTRVVGVTSLLSSESPGHVLRNHDRGQIRIRTRHFRHDGRVHDAQPFCSDHAALWVDH